MGIDPDMEPIIAELRERIGALEQRPPTEPPDLAPLVARLAAVERWQAVMDATIVAAVAKLRAWIDASPPAPPSDPG